MLGHVDLWHSMGTGGVRASDSGKGLGRIEVRIRGSWGNSHCITGQFGLGGLGVGYMWDMTSN